MGSIVFVIIWGALSSRFAENRTDEQVVGISAITVTDTASQIVSETNEHKATVYRSLSCGCCLGYIAELKKQGFTVDVKSLREQDMDPIKKQYGIPEDKQSCHTTVIGEYVIEGHVPMEAIEKLLTEKPNIDGIGLPGMPIGTPGMPGVKQTSYEVYQKNRDNFSPFMTL